MTAALRATVELVIEKVQRLDRELGEAADAGNRAAELIVGGTEPD